MPSLCPAEEHLYCSRPRPRPVDSLWNFRCETDARQANCRICMTPDVNEMTRKSWYATYIHQRKRHLMITLHFLHLENIVVCVCIMHACCVCVGLRNKGLRACLCLGGIGGKFRTVVSAGRCFYFFKFHFSLDIT